MTYQLRKTDRDVLICEGARVCGDVTLGPGVSVWFNAVIRGDDGPIRIGPDTNIQDCAVLHEAVTIGRGCTVGHGAIVHGCTIGDHVLVGMGATVLSGARIAGGCLIGAGALCTGSLDAPENSLILGSPARVVRLLTEEERADIRDSARDYLAMAARYREEQA